MIFSEKTNKEKLKDLLDLYSTDVETRRVNNISLGWLKKELVRYGNFLPMTLETVNAIAYEFNLVIEDGTTVLYKSNETVEQIKYLIRNRFQITNPNGFGIDQLLCEEDPVIHYISGSAYAVKNIRLTYFKLKLQGTEFYALLMPDFTEFGLKH